ncbi:Thioredoxin H-type [Entamoeba marina]
MATPTEVTKLDELQNAHSSGIVIVQFHTTWCSDCINIKPLYSQLRRNAPHINFVDVDVDKATDLRKPYNILHVPTFILFQNNKEIDRVSEPTYEELESLMEKAGKL